MANYFNTLTLRLQLEQLGTCEFMDTSAFENGVNALLGKKNCNRWLRRTRPKPRVKYARFRLKYCLCA